jgi:hypothetical protein
MRNHHRQVRRLGQIILAAAVAAAVALALVTPAEAQFGGLKKKLKAAAGADKPADQKATEVAAPAAPAGGGGAVVLTADVVAQLVTGLKAGESVRQAARQEDTPYTRYLRDQSRYEAAQEACQAAQQTFPTKMAADEKLSARYSGYMDRMAEAQTKQDANLTAAWADSAMAMMDPGCVVKQPSRPGDDYEAQREIDTRSEKTAVTESGLSMAEFAMARERALSILLGGPPADVSASETSAVQSRAGELKPLLGIREAPAQRATKSAPATPAAAPAPAAAPVASPAVPSGSDSLAQCMGRNAQKHQKEIEALGRRAQAAQQAGDMARVMAIADTLQQLQLAGCGTGR